MPRPLEVWTDADLIDWIGQSEYNKARRLNDAKAGRLLRDDPDYLEGEYTERGVAFRVLLQPGKDPVHSRLSCTCPAFEEGPCRHAAAVVLLARKAAHVPSPTELQRKDRLQAALSALQTRQPGEGERVLGFQIAFQPGKPLLITPARLRPGSKHFDPLGAVPLLEKVPPYADVYATAFIDVLREFAKSAHFAVPPERLEGIFPSLQSVHAFVRDPSKPLKWMRGVHRVRFETADFRDGVSVRGFLMNEGGDALPLHPQARLFPATLTDWLYDGESVVYELPFRGSELLEATLPGPYQVLPRELEKWSLETLQQLRNWGQVVIGDSHSPDLVDARPRPVVVLEEKGTLLRVSGFVRYPPSQEIAPLREAKPIVDGRTWYVRDVANETKYSKLLIATLLTEPLEEQGRWLLSADRALRFLEEELPKLDGAWEVFGREGLNELRMADKPLAPRFRIASGLDWFDTAFEFELDGEIFDGWALLRAFDKGQRYWRTKSGYVRLPQDLLRRLRERLSELPEDGRVHRAQAGILLSLLDEIPNNVVDDGWRNTAQSLDTLRRHREIAPPAGLQATLRPYQAEGLSWLAFLAENRFGGVLADDMGLGKTLQTISFLLHRKVTGGTGPTLVVAPSSVVFNWEKELAKFAPSLSVLRWTGEQRLQLLPQLDQADVVLTSYAILRRDIVLFTQRKWQSFTLDEAQAIKNAHSQTAECARAVPAEFRLALSGTPLENHLGELWSYFGFLMPGFFGSEREFQERYVRRLDLPGSNAKEQLRKRIAPFVLRRLKQDVASDLPPKTEDIVECEFGESQRNVYEAVRAAYKVSLGKRLDQEGLAKSRMHVLEALLRLRQACCDPRLLPVPEAKTLTESAKADELFRRVENAVEEDHKVIVFSQFTEMLDLLGAGFKERNIEYVRLDGSTADRQTPVERFQNDPDCKLFLISLKAGGTGLNLTAADYVFHYDPWWNPAVEDQATDRAYRIGQTRPVFVYKLIAKGTVEELMLELQAKKRGLVDGLLGDGAIAEVLGMDELKEIFGL